MEAKTIQLIGVAVSTAVAIGGFFVWLFGKLLKNNSDNVSVNYELSQAKKEIHETKNDVKDIKEDITEIKIKLK
jgi:hypothetical protein